MTREQIHELLDTIAEQSAYPIKSFEVNDYGYSGELRVAVTFQAAASKFETAEVSKEAK